jgi:hypothetical protein
MTWNQIDSAPRHGSGYEKIARRSFNVSIPKHIAEDRDLIAFRFFAMAPMVGYRDKAVFHVIWLDIDFDVYDHG